MKKNIKEILGIIFGVIITLVAGLYSLLFGGAWYELASGAVEWINESGEVDKWISHQLYHRW